ncbi:MAG: c-type cytochrome [Deltaproteobacteria bacterium]
MGKRIAPWALAGLCWGCEPAFTQPMKLGDGKVVSAATLNEGKEAFTQYCRACHGDKGDGTGPASYALRPPPRDFTTATFKFAAVSSGSLPNDADFVRIVRGGLHGTAMLAWDVPDEKLNAIIQYVKTFSPRWQQEAPGDVTYDPAKDKDPWGEAKKAEAVTRGKKLYHGLAQCLQCHAAYETKQEIYDDSKELTGTGTTEFRTTMYQPEAKESDYIDKHYAPDKDGNYPHIRLLPPDFLFNDVRSGSSIPDYYRIIASGIGGTAMPSWKASLPDADVWALAYYVHSLVDMKGTPAADALRQKLASAAPWTPPPDPDAAAATDAGTP